MTVLNVIEITNDILLYFGTFFTVIFVIGLAVVVYEALTCNSDTGLCLGVAFTVIGFTAGLILLGNAFTTPPHKEYQVIIDKNTKFYEVCDKYEIVSRDGYIFTLKDKVSEDEDKE